VASFRGPIPVLLFSLRRCSARPCRVLVVDSVPLAPPATTTHRTFLKSLQSFGNPSAAGPPHCPPRFLFHVDFHRLLSLGPPLALCCFTTPRREKPGPLFFFYWSLGVARHSWLNYTHLGPVSLSPPPLYASERTPPPQPFLGPRLNPGFSRSLPSPPVQGGEGHRSAIPPSNLWTVLVSRIRQPPPLLAFSTVSPLVDSSCGVFSSDPSTLGTFMNPHPLPPCPVYLSLSPFSARFL